jgi:hypothetical protein
MTQTTDLRPTDILLTLLAALLAPMFLTTTGGDIAVAHLAATETINDYRAQNRASLLAIAQIVAFGLCALGSLSLSMADDLSLSMTLRLRSNANSLNRSAEQNRRALNTPSHRENPAQVPAAPETMTQEDHRLEAEAIAAIAAARQTVAETEARIHPEPTPAPQTPAPPTPALPIPAFTILSKEEQQNRTLWAAAIADVAGEFTAELSNLAPAERKLTSRKIATMGSSITAILSGAPLPRLQPGALSAMIRPQT